MRLYRIIGGLCRSVCRVIVQPFVLFAIFALFFYRHLQKTQASFSEDASSAKQISSSKISLLQQRLILEDHLKSLGRRSIR